MRGWGSWRASEAPQSTYIDQVIQPFRYVVYPMPDLSEIAFYLTMMFSGAVVASAMWLQLP